MTPEERRSIDEALARRRAYGKPYSGVPTGWMLSDGGLWVKA